jgi:hypothetical protein
MHQLTAEPDRKEKIMSTAEMYLFVFPGLDAQNSAELAEKWS